MKITLPPQLIEWTNQNWPELAAIGGLGRVEYEVVNSLPFGSDAHAMTWKGKVLVRREWIEPALPKDGGNMIGMIHMWALATLAWHEPEHIIAQKKQSWFTYLLHYVWDFLTKGGYRKIPEEKAAYDHQARLLGLWKSSSMATTWSSQYSRPG